MLLNVRVKYIVLSLAFLLGSIGFIRTSITVIQSRHRLDLLQKEVSQLEMKRAQLAGDLEYQKTPEYVDMEARNKLNFIKPGERVYVVGDKLAQDLNRGVVLSQSTSNTKLSERKQNLYNWLNLLF